MNSQDVLFLPAYWHHEVQSIPEEAVGSSTGSDGSNSHSNSDNDSDSDEPSEKFAKQGLNVAVNFWFKNMTAPPLPM